MSILTDLLSRVQTVSESLAQGNVIRDVLLRHDADIMELQKLQLFAGKAGGGKDIRPYYSEDLKPRGYFHSVESAGRYAAWKESGIRYPYSVERNPDAPNLYINGRFHDELDVEFGAEMMGIVGTTPYANGIIAKYGLSTFGLMSENWMVLFEKRGAYDELMDEIKRILYV